MINMEPLFDIRPGCLVVVVTANYDSQACSAFVASNCGGGLRETAGQVGQIKQSQRGPHQPQRQRGRLEVQPQHPHGQAPTIGNSR